MDEQEKLQLLTLVQQNGLLRRSAKELSIPFHLVKKEMDDDPHFEADVQEQLDYFGEEIEQEIIERAMVGTPRKIFNKLGEHIDTVYDKSDTLLIKLAQARLPASYGNKQQITGADSGPLQILYSDFSGDD